MNKKNNYSNIKSIIKVDNFQTLLIALNTYTKIINNLNDTNFIWNRKISFLKISSENYIERTLHIPSFEWFEKLN